MLGVHSEDGRVLVKLDVGLGLGIPAWILYQCGPELPLEHAREGFSFSNSISD